MAGEFRPKKVTMIRILIPTVLVLFAALAPAADTITPTVPADTPAATFPHGNVPVSGQGRRDGQGLHRRNGSGVCQTTGDGIVLIYHHRPVTQEHA